MKKLKVKDDRNIGTARKVVYLVLRLLVFAVIVIETVEQDWQNVFMCFLTLILFMMPSILSKKMYIELPATLEVVIIVFIFAAEILGEIGGFYIKFDIWDDMLHTTNGFLAAAIGFALVDILNREEKVKFNLSPIFVSIVAFCFSMTIGVLWEFYECFVDVIFATDMQKDTWISTINSVNLNPNGINVPVHLDIESVTVNGETWNKYLDIGLYDTMSDLFVNFIGALVFSVFGFVYIKNRGNGFAARFIPTKKIDKSEQQRSNN